MVWNEKDEMGWTHISCMDFNGMALPYDAMRLNVHTRGTGWMNEYLLFLGGDALLNS